MILTAIVISMGIAAFVLALAYRSYRLTTEEEVINDPEDTRVSQQTGSEDEDEEIPQPDTARDTDAPDELDALPGFEGSK
ncbi:multisubunit Na+/H+ antiporter, MnhC subunit [Mycolicibacterium fortuitum]|nr:multisubunit Na+/H+ antiporter, MnhC subunit [Mycolicibacterium fortuitum]